MSSRTELAPDKFRGSGRESSMDCAKKAAPFGVALCGLVKIKFLDLWEEEHARLGGG